MLTPKPPMWTLEEAQALVSDLNKMVRPFDFHVALGGGVLNRGTSLKDLDLYVLPVYIKGRTFSRVEWDALDRILETALGPHDDMRAESAVNHDEGRCFLAERIYVVSWKRVDVFIVNPQ